ncbi:MAG: FmdB family zinc ribbon protein [Chloroflexota bacterium]
MPIYEYVCHDCGAQSEALRPIKDADAPIACKRCESHNTARGISVFFAQSGGRVVAGSSGGCGSCSGGSCSGCGHNHN